MVIFVFTRLHSEFKKIDVTGMIGGASSIQIRFKKIWTEHASVRNLQKTVNFADILNAARSARSRRGAHDTGWARKTQGEK